MRSLSIRNLNVWYGAKHALKEINVDLPLQQITAIIGPSGCGKSTLLKSINRLLELNEQVRVEGEVLLDGANVYDKTADVTEVRTRIGLLAQKPFPLPMSIYDNVAYGPRIHGLARGELDRNVQEHLEAVGLWSEVGDRLKAPATGQGRYTTVVVTHNLDQARRLADYVVFMWLGELIEHGPAAAVFRNPQHELTQAYLSGQIG